MGQQSSRRPKYKVGSKFRRIGGRYDGEITEVRVHIISLLHTRDIMYKMSNGWGTCSASELENDFVFIGFKKTRTEILYAKFKEEMEK